MKIAIAGKNDIAIEISETIRRSNTDSIIHYFCENEQAPTEPFRNFASYARELNRSEGIEMRCLPAKGAGRALQEMVEADAPDVFLSCQLSVIVNAQTCAFMRNRLLNFHFGPLPRYRGASPISHAILRDEARHGTTLHLIDAGIDTGPVIDIEYFDLDSHTNFDAYQACTKAGSDLLERHLRSIRAEIEQRRTLAGLARSQDDSGAQYFSRYALDYKNNVLNPESSAADVDRFVRAFTFPPLTYAKVNIDGAAHSVAAAKPLYSDRCFGAKMGEIQKLTPTTVRIATRDCWVELSLLKALN